MPMEHKRPRILETLMGQQSDSSTAWYAPGASTSSGEPLRDDQLEIASSSKVKVGGHTGHTPPTFASIASFVIDAFDTPPRSHAEVKSSPSPGLKAESSSRSRRPASADVNRSSTSPGLTAPLSSLPPHASGTASASSSRPQSSSSTPLGVPPSSSPAGSGSSTPQLRFDDSPPEDPFEYLGGSALYSIIGARLFLPPDQLRTLVDRGGEGDGGLKPELEDQVNAFGEGMWCWNRGEGRRMARARIRYDGDTRLFEAVVPPVHRSLIELIPTPLQGAQYLHISAPFSSEDVARLVHEISDLRRKNVPGAWTPKIVFEPTPSSCHSGQREWLEKIVRGINVLSPNHEEFLSFYGHAKIPLDDPTLEPTVESAMKHIIDDIGIDEDGKGILVVRCGKKGCCIGTKGRDLRWFPAYWEGGDEEKVQDVTGAGNAFLGGYSAGLSITKDPYEAVLFGTVASSFVVEQMGLPDLQSISDSGGAPDAEAEIWNGTDPKERIELFRARCISRGLL